MPEDSTAFRMRRDLALGRNSTTVEAAGKTVLTMKSRLRLRGSELDFLGPDGSPVMEGRQPLRFALWRRCLYEISRDGAAVASVYSAILPFVNPVLHVEVLGEDRWVVWKRLLGEISVTRRGAEILRVGEPIVSRGFRFAWEDRSVDVAEGENVPLLLSLAALLVRPSGA